MNLTVFKKQSQVVKREVAGETILVPISRNVADMQQIFTLNPVASFIWESIDGKRSVAGITEQITSEFDVSYPDAQNDCESFLHSLLSKKLIVECDSHELP